MQYLWDSHWANAETEKETERREKGGVEYAVKAISKFRLETKAISAREWRKMLVMQLWNDCRLCKSSLAVNLWFLQDLPNHCQGQMYNFFFVCLCVCVLAPPNFKSLLSVLHSELLCDSPFGGNDHLYGSHLAVWLKKKKMLQTGCLLVSLCFSRGSLVHLSVQSFNRSICEKVS